MKRSRTLALVAASTIAISACGGNGTSTNDSSQAPQTGGDSILIAAALYPLAEIVESVGGKHVNVINLTPPGTDAHGVELSAQQLESLNEAKITFYLGQNYQPTVQRSIQSLKSRTVDLLDSLELQTTSDSGHSDHEHAESDGTGETKDPHVWLDPAYMIDMARVVANNLSQIRPEYANEFAKNASSYIDTLEVLGKEIDTRFSNCTSRTLVTAHFSFGYFARRANLEVYSVAEINPDEQLSAKKLEELATVVKAKKVTTIFYEELVSTDLARTLADKAGVTTNTINPLEGMSQKDLDAGKTYLSVQRDNIKKIAQSLSCS